ncbi:MAG: asparagine synthase (glutamine-hydrolyzing) [Chitinispirillaceae bacterium]|nr:asparagine synthase (glutamine-hydrolyzing) [Chitinispirillaceae bacterium]
MCGICGHYNLFDPSLLDRMLCRLVRRGPDDEGTYGEGGVGLGIRRLSIIDIPGGHQPVMNETGTIHVVFNGEIYNFRFLRDELEKKGHVFRSRSDTEVIVHLYEEHGDEFVKRLRGMFAFCLWDGERKIMYLARDRFGIKPLYYAKQERGMIFASELPALHAALPGLSVDPQAIGCFLTFGYIPRPGTIFEKVSQVHPGEIISIREGVFSSRRYFDMAELARNSAPEASVPEAEERFRVLLKETVGAHLVSDVPLGLLLSSGLDSGAMLAMMRAVTDGPVKTFSIGYSATIDEEFNETNEARTLARAFNADHTEELLSPDSAALLETVVEAMGEPFADASAIPTFLVAELARRSVTVALSGIGGDELFGGYPRYLGVQAASAYRVIPPILRSFAANRLATLLPESGSHRDQAARLKRFLKSGTLPVDQQYLQWVLFMPDDWNGSAFSPEFRRSISAVEDIGAYRDLFNQWPSPAPADKAMGLDLQTYLSDDLLRMADRLSMWHSLELRVPFCDHELLAFALRLPARMRMEGWRLKGFVRSSLKGVLPQKMLSLPKRGFMVPIARWLREDLREMAGDLLSEETVRRRGYLNPAYVQWLVSEHASGRRNFSDRLFSLCVLEIWLKKHEMGTCHRSTVKKSIDNQA